MTSPPPSHGLVLDLETTATDPRATHAAILEIGAVLVEWTPELPVVAEASLVIRPAGTLAQHDIMWAQMEPVVQQMHDSSGLWFEATHSKDAWPIDDADDAVVKWLRTKGVSAQLPLIGSGIGHLDAPFVRHFMPRLAMNLTYWHVDIGNVRRMLDLAGRSDHVHYATDVEAKPHRGLDDARLHLAEARRYLQVLQQLPVSAPEVLA